MPGSMPATSQLDWLISMTAMIVLFWSRATRDLLKSFGWGIAALHRLHPATKLPFPRRPPHSVSRSPARGTTVFESVTASSVLYRRDPCSPDFRQKLGFPPALHSVSFPRDPRSRV